MTESEAIEILRFAYPKENNRPITEEVIGMATKALEKQIEMKRYCDENGCANCPYHNSSINDNRCMNDFIIETE